MMHLTFPIDSVKLSFTESAPFTFHPESFKAGVIEVEEKRWHMSIPDIGDYWVEDGERIWIRPVSQCDEASIRLFLNGSVFGAVLHQRGLIPIHGSSFVFEGKTVLLAGDSGAGKSSVTTAFCQNSARFLNDDINPLIVTDDAVRIKKIRTSVKLWEDSLNALSVDDPAKLRIRPDVEKFYVSLNNVVQDEELDLNCLIILQSSTCDTIEYTVPQGTEKYHLLRSVIYRKGYLHGMPLTKKSYFKKLLQVADSVKMYVVTRPMQIPVLDTMNFIKDKILS